MIKFSYFINKMKDVTFKDCLSVFPMTVALCLTLFYKKKYRNAWLICEEPLEARDNGYHFFKYMCINQSEQKCYYAIKKKSVDYKKVAKLGSVIEYGSIQHWVAYFLCRYNISSQKGGKPNAALCSFMELNNVFKPHNVFLQHGVTKDMAKWLFADRCRFQFFITATIPEQKMISQFFGYPKETPQLVGFSRFDALWNYKKKKNRVLIMPTWRNWFNLKAIQAKDIELSFSSSDYLDCWLKLLNSSQLNDLIEKYDLEIVFFLHRNMQKYIESFKNVNKKIIVAHWEKYDIQDLLKTSAMMITDYSSVFFDMIYMKKPIVFYQFDEEVYRKYQYQEGWFDYHNNPFGNSYREYEDVLNEIEKMAKNEFNVSESFIRGLYETFKYVDNCNSERIYKLLSEL